MHQPVKVLPWRLIAICTFLRTVGIGVVPRSGDIHLVGQAMTGIGFVAGFVGFVMLMRGRIPGGERAAFLDAAILASGTGVVVWAFGFAPYLLAAGQQNSIAAAAFFYPALIASATVAPLWFLGGAHRPATRLLVMLVLATLG
jgi:hypothetical protein